MGRHVVSFIRMISRRTVEVSILLCEHLIYQVLRTLFLFCQERRGSAGHKLWHSRSLPKEILRLLLASGCDRALRLLPAKATLFHSFIFMFSLSTSRIAVLPMAPRNGSPVPWLTSLYHKSTAGPYGDRGYPGNCSGELIKDLLLYFKPKRVLDPMTGSGTCADVCRELGIECVSFDIRDGKDACDPLGFGDIGTFDFVWVHPPYWRMKQY
ncbi:MAG: hypothetical protein JWM11_7852, partial [Planctomycetaceae bacterium]|nr:hypothetical protein [Planctomycetaceae bacterium]